MKQVFKSYVDNKELYQLQVENMTIEFKYSKNGKEINEYMLNILKQKSKIDWYIKMDTLYINEKR